MSNIKHITSKIEQYTVDIYTVPLQEGKFVDIGKGLKARFDRNNFSNPYNPNKDHLHVYLKDKELFAINRDGTANDGYHNVEIPEKVYKFISAKFPDFNLPQNRFIESMNLYDSDLHEEILLSLQG